MRPRRLWAVLPKIALSLCALLLPFFLIVPTLLLLLRGGFGLTAFDHPGFEALRVSLLTSVCALFAIVVLGTPLAWRLARSRSRFTVLIDTLLDIPVVLPPVVAGLALLITFGRNGPFRALVEPIGGIAFTPIAVVLAQIFVSAPLYVRAAKAGFLSLEPELEFAARADGATNWQIFSRITLPITRPALLEGLTLAWSRLLGEFGATLMFAGSLAGTTRTLPLLIYDMLESDFDQAVALGAFLVLVAFGLLIISRLIGPKRT